MKTHFYLLSLVFFFILISCKSQEGEEDQNNQPVHTDEPFIQDFSVKYYINDEGIKFQKILSDRNGIIQILSSNGLLKPHNGSFLYPGTLLPEKAYLSLTDKKISGLGIFQNQFVYLDDKSIFSNSWAGSIFLDHKLQDAHIFAPGKNFDFLISDGKALQYISDTIYHNKKELPGLIVIEIKYDSTSDKFWILGKNAVYNYSVADHSISKVFEGDNFTCMEVTGDGRTVFLGTINGYLELDAISGKQRGDINRKLPWPHLTYIKDILGNLWFGSERGAFMLNENGKFNYYYGERWLPGDRVVDISEGDHNTVLLLTEKGFSKIIFHEMTLHDKALIYEQQVRERHIRYGFNADLSGMEPGNINTGRLIDSDNDGLWTSMYLGAEAFRYAVTKSEEALQNCRESLDAMERLYTINPVAGFPSRSFARSGYIDKLSDPDRWQNSADPEWDWKATTSSDEVIGHIFVFAVMAEIIDDEIIKERSINLIDTLMKHIVDNDLYLIDYDGKPTTWGRWNPDYVNSIHPVVGDRKLNSSNIIAMLQTAYYFTKNEKFKNKAFELLNDHGYFKNLMRPMKKIGPAPEDAHEWSKMLSGGWNHSDDEMYFLGYWGLYRYALNDTLKSRFKETIIDHWEIERPEKEGAWNIFTALTGVADFDLSEAIWYLQEYPLDLINWTVHNSHRKDIEHLEPGFRMQFTSEVLPPDELKISRHNENRFVLNGGNNGTSESSAGDIWLLPYWMGRYLGVISESR